MLASDIVNDPPGKRQQRHDGDGDEEHEVMSKYELPASARERLRHKVSFKHGDDTTIGPEKATTQRRQRRDQRRTLPFRGAPVL
jgi:hypothetical protein